MYVNRNIHTLIHTTYKHMHAFRHVHKRMHTLMRARTYASNMQKEREREHFKVKVEIRGVKWLFG